MANKNRHKIVAVSVAFWFLLSLFLSFLLVSPYFLLFHAILEPQNSPPNEVTGIYIYSRLYGHGLVCCRQECPKTAIFRGFIVKQRVFLVCRNLGSLGNLPFNISSILNNQILILDITHSHIHGQGDSKYSTSQQKEAHFRKNVALSGEMLNMLNSGPHVESKCASFCRNVEYVDYVECLGEIRR